MDPLPSPIESINEPLFATKKVSVFVKRDDLIHPYIMGNKWRKLKYNLEEAKKRGSKKIVTVGGAYSNHIAATAYACYENGFECTGIIRGEELHPDSNPTLRFADKCGMRLTFADRKSFRKYRLNPERLFKHFEDFYFLPEGGTNHLAIKGCAEMVEELPELYDYLIVSMGTGGTMAGILKGMKGCAKLIGIPSLKGEFIISEFQQLIEKNGIPYTNYQIINNFHFGGYGRVSDELIRFINRVKASFGLQLDPIYTGKMYFGVIKLIESGFFEAGSKILVVHTGGLQGVEGFNEMHQNKILV